MPATKVTFRTQTINGDQTLTVYMPDKVAHEFFKNIMDWEENWLASFKDSREYFADQQLLIEKLAIKNTNQD